MCISLPLALKQLQDSGFIHFYLCLPNSCHSTWHIVGTQYNINERMKRWTRLRATNDISKEGLALMVHFRQLTQKHQSWWCSGELVSTPWFWRDQVQHVNRKKICMWSQGSSKPGLSTSSKEKLVRGEAIRQAGAQMSCFLGTHQNRSILILDRR